MIEHRPQLCLVRPGRAGREDIGHAIVRDHLLKRALGLVDGNDAPVFMFFATLGDGAMPVDRQLKWVEQKFELQRHLHQHAVARLNIGHVEANLVGQRVDDVGDALDGRRDEEPLAAALQPVECFVAHNHGHLAARNPRQAEWLAERALQPVRQRRFIRVAFAHDFNPSECRDRFSFPC